MGEDGGQLVQEDGGRMAQEDERWPEGGRKNVSST